VAVVPGIDGQKMSKSYDNHIELFGDEKETRSRVMRIVTDSTPLEEPKDPDSCNVFALYRLFGGENQVEEMAANYRKGGYGYGTAKKELFEAVWSALEPFRKKREALVKSPGYVESVLNCGAERAREEADKTLKKARHAVGLD